MTKESWIAFADSPKPVKPFQTEKALLSLFKEADPKATRL